MTGPLDGLTLILPVHNEATSVESTIRGFMAELRRHTTNLEVLVAEDGSTDATPDVLARIAPELGLRVLSTPAKKGYQQALVDAIGVATQPWLFVVDSDGQYDPGDFGRLWALRDANAVVIGRRLPRRDPAARRFLGWGYNVLLESAFGLGLHDLDCGYRLLRRDLARALAPRLCRLSFFTAEFVIRAHRAGASVAEVPIAHRARGGGRSSHSVAGLARASWHDLVGIIGLRRELARPVDAPAPPAPDLELEAVARPAEEARGETVVNHALERR